MCLDVHTHGLLVEGLNSSAPDVTRGLPESPHEKAAGLPQREISNRKQGRSYFILFDLVLGEVTYLHFLNILVVIIWSALFSVGGHRYQR
jgi:hypothetical protein